MKKNFLGILIVVMASAFMFIGCKGDDEPVKIEEPVKPQETTETTDMPELKLDFESMSEWYLAAVKKCHPLIQQVWNSSADPKKFNLLLVKETKDKVYLITPEGKSEVKESEWTDGFRTALQQLDAFSHIEFDGKHCTMILCSIKRFDQMDQALKTMGYKPMSDLEKVCENLALFYHESFHRYVQDGKNRWTNPKNTSGQAPQVFPVDYNSRVYRKLMVLSLVNVLYDANRKTESYSRAKYWLNKFNTEYASELERAKFTDIHEGTAEYFGRNVVHSVYHQYPVIQDYDGTNLASPLRTEAYMLSIAIDLAVRDGRKDEVLKSFVNGLQSPVEILLKDIPVPANYQESADDADRNRIVAELDKLYGPESNIMKPLFDFIATHRSGKSTYLVTKTRNNAMIQDLGHYILTDNDLKDYQASLQAIVLLENIALEGCTFLEHPATDCVFVPVDANNLTLTHIKTVEPTPHKIEGVTINGTATLSDCTPSETVTVQNLPIDVKIGKDSFGNTIYFLQNN